MAIDYKAGQAPKGPSNSNPMASTPGTQQSALQNVGGLNLNPNMPAGPQMQKRGRSSYQQSVTPPAPRAPSQSGGPRQRMPGGRPTVSRGLPMDQGRGYNVFSGMDASQISDMNRTMGMSNMTALPSLSPAANRSLTGGPGPAPGQMGGELAQMSGALETEEQPLSGVEPSYSDDIITIYDPVDIAALVQDYELGKPAVDEGSPDPTTYQDDIYDFYENPYSNVEGQLDQKYAIQLQSILAGLDRQAAMMGTFGSPAHTSMINSAVSGAFENMASEYASLEMERENMQVEMLDRIREAEDAEGAFIADVQVVSDLGANLLQDASTRIEQLESPKQRLAFGEYLNNISTQFQKEYMAADNAQARQDVYLRYMQVSDSMMGLIASYVAEDQTVNAQLSNIYQDIGLGADFPIINNLLITY